MKSPLFAWASPSVMESALLFLVIPSHLVHQSVRLKSFINNTETNVNKFK